MELQRRKYKDVIIINFLVFLLFYWMLWRCIKQYLNASPQQPGTGITLLLYTQYQCILSSVLMCPI